MKKRIFGAAFAATVGIFALASCGAEETTTEIEEEVEAPAAEAYVLSKTIGEKATKLDNGGDVGTTLLIHCWNDEWRAFFNKYVSDEGVALLNKGEVMSGDDKVKAKEGFHVDGVAVKFVETPSADMAYQNALDQALASQATATEKVDMFLAEADYIQKYVDSDKTADIDSLGVTIDQTNVYAYTKQAATDSAEGGKCKGVSFQCCPSGMIYNRVVAKKVLGTDSPKKVQAAVNDWDKFDAVAAKCKAKGYYMTACSDETFRTFSNNCSTAWVSADKKMTIPAEVEKWITQAEKYVQNEYTVVSGVWDDAKTANIAAGANKALACFGPAWYYNFCMGGSKKGDWAITKGPQAHFWGGTWILAATGTDNAKLVGQIMNKFINDEVVLECLVEVDGQFVNNGKFNLSKAMGMRENDFLGGQNDTLFFCNMTDSIVWKNHTIYDQACNEGITKYISEYLNGTATKDEALKNFKDSIKEAYPALTV